MANIFDLFLKILLKFSSQKGKYHFFNTLENASNQHRYRQYRNIYTIDNSFRFNGKDILLYGEGKIICGANSYIGDYSTIHAEAGHQVCIGNNCAISHNVRIYTANRLADQNMSVKDLEVVKGDVIIHNDVWIGANVFIKEGVTIGENSVIGANSIVTKNVPANSINGGVPCKVLKLKTFNANN